MLFVFNYGGCKSQWDLYILGAVITVKVSHEFMRETNTRAARFVSAAGFSSVRPVFFFRADFIAAAVEV